MPDRILTFPSANTDRLTVVTPGGRQVKRAEKTPYGDMEIDYESRPRPWRLALAVYGFWGPQDLHAEEAWRRKFADKRIYVTPLGQYDSPMVEFSRDREVMRRRIRGSDMVICNTLAWEYRDHIDWIQDYARIASEEGVPFLSEEEALRQ